MRSRLHRIHRLILDDESGILPPTQEALDSICDELVLIRERLDQLPTSRSMVYLDMTIDSLKSSNP